MEKEEAEVRRQSSVNPHAMQLATKHRRYSAMSDAGRGSFYHNEKDMESGHKEEV